LIAPGYALLSDWTRRLTAPGGDTVENRETMRKLVLHFAGLLTPRDKWVANLRTLAPFRNSPAETLALDLLTEIERARQEVADGK
jgi:hypothetical protein